MKHVAMRFGCSNIDSCEVTRISSEVDLQRKEEHQKISPSDVKHLTQHRLVNLADFFMRHCLHEMDESR